jgi:hypothetical protein
MSCWTIINVMYKCADFIKTHHAVQMRIHPAVELTFKGLRPFFYKTSQICHF